MDLSAPALWWIAAGVLVAVELATGTFYLLMLAVGCAAAAIGAHLGAGLSVQLVVAAVLGLSATAAWHLRRSRGPQAAPAAANRDVNLDIGETVNVQAWDGDGHARASYRGAAWAVRYAGSGLPAPGEHTIVAVEGNRLSLVPAAARR